MGDWDEESHPRDEAGKFSAGGGGTAGHQALRTWAAMRGEKKAGRDPTASQVLSGIRGITTKKSGESKAGEKQARPQAERTWVDSRADLPKETWSAHYNANPNEGGQPTAAREREVHAPIMRAALDKVKPVPAGEQKIAVMTMGAPASGKSSGLRSIDTSNFVHVDPDGIKEKLPEYQRAIDPKATYRGAALMAHEESSHIAKKIMAEGIKQGKNLVVDGTGTNAKSMMEKMQALKQAGYHVHLAMSHLDQATGLQRAAKRAEETGRAVPEKVIKEGYQRVPKNFSKIAREAHTFQVIDTRRNGGKAVWSKDSTGREIHHDPMFVATFKKEHGE